MLTTTTETEGRFTYVELFDGSVHVATVTEADGHVRWARTERDLLSVSGGTAATVTDALAVIEALYADEH